jgi:IclR family KDG regulon transcriptional repressor
MRHLAEQTGETIVLTVLNDNADRAVCIERIESRYDLRLHLEVGGQSYLHAGASSKVLLAYLPAEAVSDLAGGVGLPALADDTITDLPTLEEELERIREQGYAFSREETDRGAWGLAAPILDGSLSVIAGIGIASPISRHSENVEQRFLSLTLDASRQIGRALGVVTEDVVDKREPHGTA